MASDMYLKIEGVEGESADDKHKKEIDIESFSWGMTQTGTMHAGGGGGAGKVNVQDMTITKKIDKSTPTLAIKCANGEHISKATLTCRKAGKEALEYYIVTMEGVMISSVSIGGSEQDEQPTEMISLNFSKVNLKYTPQKTEGGSGDASVEAGWDVKAHKEL